MSHRRERIQGEPQWLRKLIPVGIGWALFILVNSTVNQAPGSLDQLTLKGILLFFCTLFVALYMSLALLLRSRRRGFLGAFFICSLLFLKLSQLTQPLTVILLVLFVGFLEWYFARHDPSKLRPMSPVKE